MSELSTMGLTEAINDLKQRLARADWIAARVSQLLAGTDRLNYERAMKRAADEYDSSAFPLE
jgi:hypothetical protein